MAPNSLSKEGKRAPLVSSCIIYLYRVIKNEVVRDFLRRRAYGAEGGAVYSLTIREIYKKFHGVDIGLYTIGTCEFRPGNLPPGTVVGRYCSIYYSVRVLTTDSPGARFLVPGLFQADAVEHDPSHSTKWPGLEIGNDVFIGHNAIILPSVRKIADGAVIGAGSVVKSDVPPYAIVAGNPARVVKFRFSKEKIQELLESKWWLKSIDDLCERIEDFQKPLEGDGPIR